MIDPVALETGADVPSPKSMRPEAPAQEAATRTTPCDWVTWSDPPEVLANAEAPTAIAAAPGAPGAPTAIAVAPGAPGDPA